MSIVIIALHNVKRRYIILNLELVNANQIGKIFLTDETESRSPNRT